MARALAVALLPAEQARLPSARTIDPEVYKAYVRGSSLWKSLMPADVDAAERQFELALERDPSYAPAHAGLAWVWGARNQIGYSPWSEAVPRAREAALRAIALDEDSAEAHAALAAVKTWGEWDWPDAEKAWVRAIELNPSDSNTQAYYAHFLAHRGRAEEGLRHSDISTRLDPFNALNHALRGVVLVYLKRYDEAMEAALQDPAAVLVMRSRGQFHEATGIALRYLDAGDHEQVIAWLQKGYDQQDPGMPYTNLPPFDRLRGDPRYEALMRRIGISIPTT